MFGSCLCAGPAATDLAESSDEREIEALLAGLQPSWTFTGGATLAAGYKDNLLLGHSDPAASPFVRAGVEALLWRVPRGRIDYFGFVTAEYTRFTEEPRDRVGRKVGQEAEAFAGLEWRYRIPDRFSATFDVQGYHLDQVFDVSEVTGRRRIEALKVNGGKLASTVRWSPVRWAWVEISGSGDRQRFANGFNDADLTEGSARLGGSPARWLDLSVAGSRRRREFDRRPRMADFGDLPGLLQIRESEAEARIDTHFGTRAKWRTRTVALRREYRDNALGFLDFDQRGASQEVELSTERWLLRLDGAYRHKKYPHQTVGLGIDPPIAVREEVSGRLRVERKLSARWTLLLEAGHERSRSNDEVASYRANEGLLGARWNWEK